MAEVKKFQKLDLEELRKRYEQSSGGNSGGGGNMNFFQPDNGTYVFRLLPSVTPELLDPFVEVYYHKGMGANRDTTIICPETYKQPCAICTYRWDLYKTKDASNIELAKEYKNKSKHYCNILIKGYTEKINPSMDVTTLIKEEDFKTVIYGMHYNLFNDFRKYLTNIQYGDITDVTEGRDFTYVIGENKTSGRRDHILTPFAYTSPISKNQELIDNLPNTIGDLTLFKKPVTFEQTKLLLEETLFGSKKKDTVVASAPPVPTSAPVAPTPVASAPVVPAVAPTPVAPAPAVAPVAPAPAVSKKTLPCFGDPKKYVELDVLCQVCQDKATCKEIVADKLLKEQIKAV